MRAKNVRSTGGIVPWETNAAIAARSGAPQPGTASCSACTSEAKTRRSPSRPYSSGFSPNGSVASVRERSRSSYTPNANIALMRSRAPSPHCIQACSRTSVSDSVTNVWPSASSSARRSR